MLERTLAGSRYLVVITILLTTVAAISLYLVATLSAVTVIVDTAREGPWLPKVAKEAAINFLNVVDLLLIAAGFQMIAFGVHRIFLNSNLDVPPGLQVSNFGELKVSLVKLVGLVLLILFLEYAFKFGPGLPILYFGLAISVLIAACAWAIHYDEEVVVRRSESE